MTRNILSFTVLLAVMTGCAWLGSEKSEIPKKTEYSQTVKIINEKKLVEGGKLLLVAFKPGPEVAADQEFDKIAFLILKGIADELSQAGGAFDLLSSERAEEADLILEGWILSTGQSNLARKLMFMNEMPELVIEGSMVDRKSGNKILVFNNARRTETPGEGLKDLGQKLGSELGAYIKELINK